MKKIILILLVCLLFIPCLYAQESEFVEIEFVSDEDLLEKQKAPFRIGDRFFEIGFNAEFIVSNNYLSIGEIFSKTIVLDIDKLKSGFKFNFGVGATPLYFNFDSHKGWGFGMSLNADVTGILGISGKLLSFNETEGDKSDLSGAAHLSAEFKSFFHIQNFKVKVKPALYYTLAYIKPDVSYTFLNTAQGTEFFIDYDIRLYTVFPMEDYPNSFKLTGTPGFDISLGVEYPLSKALGLNKFLPFLDFDVGLDLVNIPIISSTVRDYMDIKGKFGSDEPFYVISEDTLENEGEEGGNSSGLGSIFNNTYTNSYGVESVKMERPFKILISANWRPLNGSRLLTITPVLGFSISRLYLQPFNFEGGINATLDLANLFILTAGINHFDQIWINSLDFSFNFRAIQLDLGIDMRSQDFIKSWAASGIGVRIGLRFGW